jgi:hypothetical protein
LGRSWYFAFLDVGALQFSWYGELKRVSSSLIGVSPEFEVALYTLCFLCGEESNIVTLGPYRTEITCHKYRSRGAEYIGTTFPGPAPADEDQAAAVIQRNYRDTRGRRTH